MNRLKRTLKYAYINNDMNETPEKWTMDVFTFFLYNQKERFIYISLNTSIFTVFVDLIFAEIIFCCEKTKVERCYSSSSCSRNVYILFEIWNHSKAISQYYQCVSVYMYLWEEKNEREMDFPSNSSSPLSLTLYLLKYIWQTKIDFYYVNTLYRISIKNCEWKRLNRIEYYDIE